MARSGPVSARPTPAVARAEAGRSAALVAVDADAQVPPPAPLRCTTAEWSFTPLSRASFEGNVAAVQSALARVPPDDRPDACHPTPLMQALSPFIGEPNASARLEGQRSLRKLRIARLLLDAGAQVRVADRNRMTVLHYAVLAYFPEGPTSELVRRVLTSGADVDARTDSGVTPLMMAVDRRRADIVRILLEAGADPNCAAATGETPSAVAQRLGDADIARMLREHSAVEDAGAAEHPR